MLKKDYTFQSKGSLKNFVFLSTATIVLFLYYIILSFNSLTATRLIITTIETAINKSPIFTQNCNASFEFSTLREMLSSDLSEGAVATTKGFYFPGDGGGAEYLITRSNGPANNMTSFNLNNDLLAILKVNNNTINVDSLGAHGDGLSDDISYIQAAFDSGYKVVFGKSKTYKIISNGIMMNNANLLIEGNNSHIIVDDSYSPSNTEFFRYILRGSYAPHETVKISNLSFDINLSTSKYTASDYLCVIHPLFFDVLRFNNVNIAISPSTNNITCFWMYYGCKELTLNNCNFTNNTTNKEGGIIFLHSRNDDRYNRYNAFKNVSIQSCTFSGTCGDEALAIWGPNSVNAQINNSNFTWVRGYFGNTSRPINISSSENSACKYNVKFNACNFTCSDSQNGYSCDSFLGLGTTYPSTKIGVQFNNCKIIANVRDALIHFQQLPKQPGNIANFDYYNDRYDLQFNSCEITCNESITGSNSFYNGSSGATWAIDCSFSKCSISCKYCFALLQFYSSQSYYYIPKITVNNCEITIFDSMGVFYKTVPNSHADISTTGNIIKATGSNSEIEYRYNTAISGMISQRNSPSFN